MLNISLPQMPNFSGMPKFSPKMGQNWLSSKLRRHEAQQLPEIVQLVISAMSEAARASGPLDDAKIQTISDMVHRMSEREYTTEEVMEIIAMVEGRMNNKRLLKMTKPLGKTQRLAVLKAAHAVVAADDDMPGTAMDYLKALANRLHVQETEFNAVLAR